MGQYPTTEQSSDPICFSPYLYRARNLVERFFNKIKHYRRVATRYDKLAANYLAFVQLASIRLWLRFNKSTSCARSRHQREVYSTTSSARAITEGGTTRPRAFAVFRLIKSLNFDGC